MRVDRHQGRILAMQILAQLEVQGETFLEELDRFLAASDLAPNRQTASWAGALARRCWEKRQALDTAIASVAEHWSINRMSPADRNTLRVALVELKDAEVPPKVAITEAIDIAREYGSADSARFVNGILDALYRIQATQSRQNEDVG